MLNPDQPKDLILSDKCVKAVKEHSCWLCKRIIEKGMHYRKLVLIGEDGFECVKEHLSHNWNRD